MSAYASNEFTVSEKVRQLHSHTPSSLTDHNLQVELLVNILQQLVPDVPIYLLHWLFVDLQREPPWLDVALPKGKLVNLQMMRSSSCAKLLRRLVDFC